MLMGEKLIQGVSLTSIWLRLRRCSGIIFGDKQTDKWPVSCAADVLEFQR